MLLSTAMTVRAMVLVVRNAAYLPARCSVDARICVGNWRTSSTITWKAMQRWNYLELQTPRNAVLRKKSEINTTAQQLRRKQTAQTNQTNQRTLRGEVIVVLAFVLLVSSLGLYVLQLLHHGFHYQACRFRGCLPFPGPGHSGACEAV